MSISDFMTLTRSQFLFALSGAGAAAAEDPPRMHSFERQDVTVANFQASGYILDIGGGGEGIIGQMKPAQVIAIDLSKRELDEAPAGPLKIVMDAANLKFLRVLTRGGRWLVWEAVIPRALEKDTRGPVFRFRFHLPGKVVQTGYGTLWPE